MPLILTGRDEVRGTKGRVSEAKTAYAPVCTSLWGTVFHNVKLQAVGQTFMGGSHALGRLRLLLTGREA
jgi:hypothetical protein